MGSGIGGGGNRRADAWRKIRHTCVCGRAVYGNGVMHQRTCDRHLAERGWPMEDAMREAVRQHCWENRSSGVFNPTRVIESVERGLGKIYLQRRASGDRSALNWTEYKKHVWGLVDRALLDDQFPR